MDLDHSAFRGSEIVIVGRTLEMDSSAKENQEFYKYRHLLIAVDEVLSGDIGGVAEAYAQINVLGHADRGDEAWIGQSLIFMLSPDQKGTAEHPWTVYQVPKQTCGHSYVLKGTQHNIALVKSWIAGGAIEPSKLDLFEQDQVSGPLIQPKTLGLVLGTLFVLAIGGYAAWQLARRKAP